MTKVLYVDLKAQYQMIHAEVLASLVAPTRRILDNAEFGQITCR